MSTKAPRAVIQQLKVLRERATFENAGFGNDDAESQRIKDATKIYRESWMIPAIDELIEWAEGEATAKHLHFTMR